MRYTAGEIKARLSLPELFRRDGIELKRHGRKWRCCCPWHSEKTPSCYVEEMRFKCFGCGAGGDVFDYWAKQRPALDKAGVFAEVLGLAGLGQAEPTAPVVAAPKKQAPEPEAMPLTERQLARWAAAVEKGRDPKWQEKIAAWRKVRPATVAAFVEAGFLGQVVEDREPCAAFAVVRADGLQMGWHTRMPDSAPMKWLYRPKGIGAWPLILGRWDVSTRLAMILEGQWDALAFCDAAGWGATPPATVCVVGIRGTNNWRLLEKYERPTNAKVLVIPDMDPAGLTWLDPESLVTWAKTWARQVQVWELNGAKDFNDAHGVAQWTPAEVRAFLLQAWRVSE